MIAKDVIDFDKEIDGLAFFGRRECRFGVEMVQFYELERGPKVVRLLRNTLQKLVCEYTSRP